jgi:hypothetical protein
VFNQKKTVDNSKLKEFRVRIRVRVRVRACGQTASSQSFIWLFQLPVVPI